jgi:hypothetical protein
MDDDLKETSDKELGVNGLLPLTYAVDRKKTRPGPGLPLQVRA